MISADRVQTQQVLINLILNAVQSMEGLQEQSRRVIISAATGADRVVVSVADTGPGVDVSVQDRLFTAFSSTRADGMGLGLSICASIVRRHGGQIWLDAEHAGGARFNFSMPIHKEAS